MLLAYAILLPDAVHNRVRETQLAIEREYGRNPTLRLEPHITLKQPFEAATLEPFVTYLEDLAHDVPSFEIVITGIRSFDDGTLFLDVIQDPRLDILRRRILRDLAAQGVRPAPVEDGRYHFHATLATGLPPDEFARAQATPRPGDARENACGIPLHLRYSWIVLRSWPRGVDRLLARPGARLMRPRPVG